MAEPFITLTRTLIEHKRIWLAAAVFRRLFALYKERTGLHQFVVRSSHELTDELRIEVERFLARAAGQGSIYTYTVDNRLIAGIRMQSDTLLWENSVRKQLNTVRRAATREGIVS